MSRPERTTPYAHLDSRPHRAHRTWRPFRRPRQQAFSLIELLVVLAIMAVLAAILLVGLGRARKQAQRLRDRSDLRQEQIIQKLDETDDP